MLAASENNAISDDHPNEYLPRLAASLGDDAEAVFESNFLPSPHEVDYSSLEYPEFLELRAGLLLEDITKLSNGNGI